MPIEYKSKKAIRIYKEEPYESTKWVSTGIFHSNPGTLVNSSGTCSPVGSKQTMMLGTGMPARYEEFVCTAYTATNQYEILEMKDSKNVVHKRNTYRFDSNGGTAVPSVVATWGAENIQPANNPVKDSYDFLGWSTIRTATSPNVTFPILAPQNATTYYAVWYRKEKAHNFTVSTSADGGTVTIRNFNEYSSTYILRGWLSPSGYEVIYQDRWGVTFTEVRVSGGSDITLYTNISTSGDRGYTAIITARSMTAGGYYYPERTVNTEWGDTTTTTT